MDKFIIWLSMFCNFLVLYFLFTGNDSSKMAGLVLILPTVISIQLARKTLK